MLCNWASAVQKMSYRQVKLFDLLFVLPYSLVSDVSPSLFKRTRSWVSITLIALRYRWRHPFRCRSGSRWNWSHDNSITVPSKHIYVLSSSMGSINIMLSWPSQKNMKLVHVDDITSNRILIMLGIGTWHRSITLIRTWAMFDPSNIVRMRMQFCV